MAAIQPRPVGSAPVHFRDEHIKVPWYVTLGAWTGRRVSRSVQILWHDKVMLVGLLLVAGAALASIFVGPWPPFAMFAAVVVFGIGWMVKDWASFERVVIYRVRASWRGFWHYRRRWHSALRRSRTLIGKPLPPVHLHTDYTPFMDTLLVRMVTGQEILDYTENAERLARSFRKLDCRPRALPDKPHMIELRFLVKDPLLKIVEPPPVDKSDPLPIGGVPIAKLENGEWWRLKIIGHHTLITGATEAGKSGVIWALIQALQEAIDARLAQLWVIDPRGGMELGLAADMFARFVFEHEEVYADLLEDAVRVMRRRQAAALGIAKIHIPTIAEPQIVLVVDEIGSLTNYTNNRPARKRIEAALALLLSQGRLSGISVIGCIQDPRKETLHLRDLFPTRICLRVTEAEHVGMLFGPGAVARGARCHLISEKTPGVGYVGVDGHPDYDRVRFSHDPDWIAGLRRHRTQRRDPHRDSWQQPPGRHLHLVTDDYVPIPRLTNL